MGISHFITVYFQTADNFAKLMSDSQYSLPEMYEILNNKDFIGMNQLLYYGDMIFKKYIQILKVNLHSILNKQISESIIFLVVGIVTLIIGFFYGWLPFMKKMHMKVMSVKISYSAIPLSMILENNYIKKWLKDNSNSSLL